MPIQAGPRRRAPQARNGRRGGSSQGGISMTAFDRTLVRCALALAVMALAAEARAQDYPSRAVTVVVPQAPAASSDLLARTLGERLNAAWGQPVIIDNRPGAGGNVGAAYAARAPADGYTLMVGT